MSKFVTLGDKAQIFHDQATGITVRKGQVVELNVRQLSVPHIKRALQGGHLVYVQVQPKQKEKPEVREPEPLDGAKILAAIKKKFDKGQTKEKIVASLNLEKAKAAAEAAEIEVEENDTVETICDAILETFNENSGESEE